MALEVPTLDMMLSMTKIIVITKKKKDGGGRKTVKFPGTLNFFWPLYQLFC